jgi:hypothetical protein
MQTFVPYPDLRRSAEVLDDKRLGKQRVEAMQIIRALTRPTYGWKHHPAVLMWKGYEPALARYAAVICEEWTKRGHADTCDATIRSDLRQAGIVVSDDDGDPPMPPWWGDDAVHRSHRSALLRKDPDHYATKFEPDLTPDLDYVWPVRSKATQPR